MFLTFITKRRFPKYFPKCLQRVPLQFFKQEGFLKNALLHFRLYVTIRNSYFLSDIKIFQQLSNNFSQYNPNFGGGGSKILRYIRLFDVTSELYFVLLSRRRRYENKHSHLYQHAISEVRTFHPK